MWHEGMKKIACMGAVGEGVGVSGQAVDRVVEGGAECLTCVVASLSKAHDDQ